MTEPTFNSSESLNRETAAFDLNDLYAIRDDADERSCADLDAATIRHPVLGRLVSAHVTHNPRLPGKETTASIWLQFENDPDEVL